MNCESVEPFFSDYIDGILDPSSTFGLQAHLRFCPDCRATLAGMSQVCMALHSLGGTSPPASFKLQLSNRLQEELHRRRWPWKRPMAWGLALAAALAILLWPEAEAERADVAMALDAVPARAVPPADRQLGSIWTEQFPSPAHAGAGAHMRPVSF